MGNNLSPNPLFPICAHSVNGSLFGTTVGRLVRFLHPIATAGQKAEASFKTPESENIFEGAEVIGLEMEVFECMGKL